LLLFRCRRDRVSSLEAVGLAEIPFGQQGKQAYRIDCLVRAVAVGVTGVVARKPVIACDRVKLARVVRAGVMPLGVWDSRVWKHPASVIWNVLEALDGHLAVWGWNVPIAELPEDVREQVVAWMQ
jgi:hypothetical protein